MCAAGVTATVVTMATSVNVTTSTVRSLTINCVEVLSLSLYAFELCCLTHLNRNIIILQGATLEVLKTTINVVFLGKH